MSFQRNQIMKSKIAYLISSKSWGGLEMNQLRNARWMCDAGFEVVLFCQENSSVHNAAKTEEGIDVQVIPPHKKYYDFKCGKSLARTIDTLNITHLIVRDTRDISLAVIAKRHAKNKLHLSYFMEMQLGVSKRNFLHTLRFSYIDMWSCPLNWLHQQVLELTKMKPEKVVVIPSGIDLTEVNNTITVQQARSILDLPQEATIVGLIGRIDKQKGQLILLQALQLMKNERVAICFLGESTFGEADIYANELKDFVEDNKLENRVFFRPFRKDISVFYRAIDRLVMATNSETFGMVTLEALAHGVPVIASNSGGSPELLEYGRIGFLFEPMNPASLAEKLERSLDFNLPFPIEELKRRASEFDKELMGAKIQEYLKLKSN